MFNLQDLNTVSFVFFALSFVAAVGLTVVRNLSSNDRFQRTALDYLNVNIIAVLGTLLLTQNSMKILLPLAVSIGVSMVATRLLKNFTVSGRLLLTTNILFMLSGLIWGTWFIASAPISTLTRVLLLIGFPILVLSLFVGLVSTFEQWEVICRRIWARPRSPLSPESREHYPKVSLHVPAYSEPPDMVIATLDTIANINYPNFEVLVIDNNTKDHSLWRPVEEHCRSLGKRFRFFHVDPLSGAKAGALNFALRHTASDAEIIGVIDSDYQVEPDFLERLVGYFDDSEIGFVQTPHDYRDWENSFYQRMCYWEYKFFFETTMPSLNERDAALTVGTMCLIRRKALEEAGGWSEWCATEDSELSIRIHAEGYSSVYTTTTFGRGLIPETFSGYKKQRFRWTYGPVQELKRHFRLYLPWFLGRDSELSVTQKIHHLNHGLGYLNIGLSFFLLFPIGIATLVSMLMHQEVLSIPLELWVGGTALLMTQIILPWLIYRVQMGCTLKDIIGAFVASRALNHTYIVASTLCLFTRKIAWRRTSKFKPLPLGLGALSSVQAELSLGLAVLLIVAGVLTFLPQFGLHLLLLGGVLYRCLDYLSAPALALLADLEITLQHEDSDEFVGVKRIAETAASE